MMQQCPKGGSNEIASDLQILGGEDHPPFVEINEPEPVNRPFIWMQKSDQTHFKVDICGACGYSEFYADNYKAVNEGWKKGYRDS
jgi:predicted nucleic-acid-binding Zn-ribbon protein